MILHIDMNSFFASVEQAANPFIRGLPVAVGNPSYENSALVAVSYPAKRKGVKSFMRAREARMLCPELLIVPADFTKYYSVNRQIVSILREYTPMVEVYSIDEAFMDFTPVMHLYNKTLPEIAQEIKDRIRSEVGESLTSSVGIADNKLLAKVASDWQKPDGLTVVEWDKRFEFLDKVPIQDIWGIGMRGGPKLTKLGIVSTKQLRNLSDADLRGLVGSYYTRLRMIANGEHYDPVTPGRSTRKHKTMQHAHTLSTPTRDLTEIKSIIRKMSERLAKRLRKHGQTTSLVQLGLRPEKQIHYGWGYTPGIYGQAPTAAQTSHGNDIYQAACQILETVDLEENRIRLISVGVASLIGTEQQPLSIFQNTKHINIDQALDEIDAAYGEFTIRTGDILYQYAKETELSVHKEDMTFHPD